MADLDDIFGKLGASPVPTALAGIDDAVFAGLASHHAATLGTSGRVMGIAAIGALVVGVGGAALPGTSARAAQSLLPFGTPAMLAPSSLLGGSE